MQIINSSAATDSPHVSSLAALIAAAPSFFSFPWPQTLSLLQKHKVKDKRLTKDYSCSRRMSENQGRTRDV